VKARGLALEALGLKTDQLDVWCGSDSALHLGAHTMIAMHVRYEFAAFFTGVKEDNIASARVCTKLGLAKTNNSILIAFDKSVLP